MAGDQRPGQNEIRKLHDQIRNTLLGIDGIIDVHHQHLWSLDGEHHVLTAHIVVDGNFDSNEYGVMKSAAAEALSQYELAHTTIEIELKDESCRDDST